jgi:hypothetical protein
LLHLQGTLGSKPLSHPHTLAYALSLFLEGNMLSLLRWPWNRLGLMLSIMSYLKLLPWRSCQ